MGRCADIENYGNYSPPALCLRCTVSARICRGLCRNEDERNKTMHGISLERKRKKKAKRKPTVPDNKPQKNPCLQCAGECRTVCQRTKGTCNAKERWNTTNQNQQEERC